jgi:hypothetical protein
MMKGMQRTIAIQLCTMESPMPHDRKHDLNAEEATGVSAEDHTGERDTRLSAKSLAARGDAPDGSEDGSPEAREQPDGSPGA